MRRCHANAYLDLRTVHVERLEHRAVRARDPLGRGAPLGRTCERRRVGRGARLRAMHGQRAQVHE
jgi:hypothetical protein